MKKEWLLTIASTVLTVVTAIALLRWLAPGLLGYAVDQQLVRLSHEVPPFYSNVFREEDYASSSFILKDPVLVSRAKPLFPDVLSMGPNDILGFRNRSVPNRAAIVTIGDSQTYGNNAALEHNWPSQLRRALFGNGPEHVYNMSVGAWGGVNYLAISKVALRLRPEAVVIAFYTGNDPYSDFRNAYSMEGLAHLRPDPTLTTSDMRKTEFPVPPEEIVRVEFDDGISTRFTPAYRYISNNREDPVVLAGYEIMARTADEISRHLSRAGVDSVFTIIPTKEHVYAPKIAAAELDVNEVYDSLVADERKNTAELASRLEALPDAQYVDVIGPLQEAALAGREIYPESEDGHPIAAGYRVIADAISDSIERPRVALPKGLVAIVEGETANRIMLLTAEGVWWVPNRDMAVENGWDVSKIRTVPLRHISALPYLGPLEEVDPSRFGPDAF